MQSMKKAGFLLASLALALLAVSRPHAQAQSSPEAGQPQLAILDTDIGDDIDDAFALALALRSPELKLLGVTTEFGDTTLRARLVSRYLSAVGRTDIPVAAGVPTAAANHFTQAAYARRSPQRAYPDAVTFLLDQIRAHPGQITVIAIGPLFNIQAAIARDPATFRKVRRVVLMGGSVYRGYDDARTGAHRPPDAEWNIRCNPAGLRVLLAAGVPVYMMPLDSTQIHLPVPLQGQIYAHGSALTDQLALLYHQWTGVKQWRLPTLYDPVAVTYAIRPDLCPARPLRLQVDDKGFTHPVPGEPNAQVCLQSDENGFLSFLMDRVTADPAD